MRLPADKAAPLLKVARPFALLRNRLALPDLLGDSLRLEERLEYRIGFAPMISDIFCSTSRSIGVRTSSADIEVKISTDPDRLSIGRHLEMSTRSFVRKVGALAFKSWYTDEFLQDVHATRVAAERTELIAQEQYLALTDARYADPLRLERFGFKVHLQRTTSAKVAGKRKGRGTENSSRALQCAN
jgi:hypothetical protein